jgi:hypothetical protein
MALKFKTKQRDSLEISAAGPEEILKRRILSAGRWAAIPEWWRKTAECQGGWVCDTHARLQDFVAAMDIEGPWLGYVMVRQREKKTESKRKRARLEGKRNKGRSRTASRSGLERRTDAHMFLLAVGDPFATTLRPGRRQNCRLGSISLAGHCLDGETFEFKEQRKRYCVGEADGRTQTHCPNFDPFAHASDPGQGNYSHILAARQTPVLGSTRF